MAYRRATFSIACHNFSYQYCQIYHLLDKIEHPGMHYMLYVAEQLAGCAETFSYQQLRALNSFQILRN
ncbi:MAG: hypothetical protein ACRC62_03300 [Microcoleus sp.]